MTYDDFIVSERLLCPILIINTNQALTRCQATTPQLSKGELISSSWESCELGSTVLLFSLVRKLGTAGPRSCCRMLSRTVSWILRKCFGTLISFVFICCQPVILHWKTQPRKKALYLHTHWEVEHRLNISLQVSGTQSQGQVLIGVISLVFWGSGFSKKGAF